MQPLSEQTRNIITILSNYVVLWQLEESSIKELTFLLISIFIVIIIARVIIIINEKIIGSVVLCVTYVDGVGLLQTLAVEH